MKRVLLAISLLGLTTIRVLPEPAQFPQNRADLGTIRGMVTRTGSSDPVLGALITATTSGPFGRGGGTAAQRGNPAPLSAKSDSTGRFVIENVPIGQHIVRAELEGYFGPEVNGSSPTFVNTTVTVAAGQQTPEVRFSFVPGSAISGQVWDTDGRPAVNANIQALRVIYQNGDQTLQAAVSGSTDDRGGYRLYRIPPAEYYLAVTSSATAARGRGFGGGGGFGLRAAPGVRTFYPGTTDISNAQRIILRGGEELSGTNFNLKVATTITVSGRITSAVPIPQRTGPRGNAASILAQLILVPNDKTTLTDPTSQNIGSVSLDAAGNGTFQLSGILSGSYDLFVRVINPAAAEDRSTVSAGTQPAYFFGRTSFDANLRDVEGLFLVMRPGVDLKVKVTVDGNATADTSAVRILPQSDDSAKLLPGYSGRPGTLVPGPDGLISIPFVYEGRYRIQANIFSGVAVRGQREASSPSMLDAYVQDVRETGAGVHDNGFEVGTRPPGLIEVLVKTDGGILEGVAYDSQQNPRPSTTVVLVPPEPRRRNPALYKTATSNAMGGFGIRGIAPGTYKLFAWESIPAGAYQVPGYLTPYEAQGRTVVINPKSTTTVTVNAIPAGK